MKQTMITTVIILMTLFSFGQSNNPYNQNGVDFMASFNIISDDFNAGKVKDFTQESIDHYSGAIPIRSEIRPTLEMTASLLRTVKSPDFNLDNLIEGSNLSVFSKNTIKDVAAAQSSATLLSDLASISDRINGESISSTEKEYLLSLVAVSYNVNSAYGNPITAHHPINGQGMVQGLLGGYIIGSYWGPVGGLIGALICGVAGALC